MRLAAVTVCKNRLDDLKRTLPLLVAAGFDEVVLVDAACPQGSGDWARAACPEVLIVREEEETFNLSRARNLGARHSTADWLFFVDADILVHPQLTAFLRAAHHESYFFRSARTPGQRVTAWGSFAVARDAFERVGGYDEVFSGWGCEDDELFYKLTINGISERSYPVELVREIITEEPVRMHYSPVKQKPVQHALNLMYLQAKKQVWASGQDMSELPLAVRQALYDAVVRHTAKVQHVLEREGATCKITINLPKRQMTAFRPMCGVQVMTLEFHLAALAGAAAAARQPGAQWTRATQNSTASSSASLRPESGKIASASRAMSP